MNISVANAMALGWAPAEPGEPATYLCEAGCGRSVTHFKSDPTCGYCCPYCKEQAVAYAAHKTKAAKKTED